MSVQWNQPGTMFRITDMEIVDIKVCTVVTTELVAQPVELRPIKVVDAELQTPVAVTMCGKAIAVSLKDMVVVPSYTRVITGLLKRVVKQVAILVVLRELVVIRTQDADAMVIDTVRPVVAKLVLAA
ncbi:MAG: hypothetical protein COA78_32900 [Blastopirellula sp.]|nr:MAG: hypothetical protein COA78_32900 [Blastopirellula sp.]